MQGPGAPDWQALREQAENQWVPQMITTLDISPRDLPVIWDADFLFGPPTAAGADTWVLCEINVSAVWPFPRPPRPPSRQPPWTAPRPRGNCGPQLPPARTASPAPPMTAHR
jgi:hypothetical protein